jgi:hypothetical protein
MEIRKGIVKDYDSGNHQADVMIIGSMATMVKAVPVAHHVGGELMAAGTLCGVLFFAAGDPGLVLCTWDGAPSEWITSDLIKDGEVAFADLAASAKSQVLLDAATNNTTTSSTDYTDMDGSNLVVSVPTGQTADIFLLAAMSARVDTAGCRVGACVYEVGGGSSYVYYATSGGANQWQSLVVPWAVQGAAAGGHTFRISWAVVTGGTTATANRPYIYAIVVPT